MGCMVLIVYLHRCILVRWDPIVSRNSGDNRLVCEMFSCQMSVHHPPFCVLLCLCCISRLVVEAHATRIKCGWLGTASSSMFHIRRVVVVVACCYCCCCCWCSCCVCFFFVNLCVCERMRRKWIIKIFCVDAFFFSRGVRLCSVNWK